MTQLILSVRQLKQIGFIKTIHTKVDEFNPERVTYRIPILNGCFYYNENEPVYRWYQEIKLGGISNYICLNITDAPSLFTLLRSFGANYNLVII